MNKPQKSSSSSFCEVERDDSRRTWPRHLRGTSAKALNLGPPEILHRGRYIHDISTCHNPTGDMCLSKEFGSNCNFRLLTSAAAGHRWAGCRGSFCPEDVHICSHCAMSLTQWPRTDGRAQIPRGILIPTQSCSQTWME